MLDFEDSQGEFAKLGREIARAFRQLLKAFPEEQSVAGVSQLQTPDVSTGTQPSAAMPPLTGKEALPRAEGPAAAEVQATSLVPPNLDQPRTQPEAAPRKQLPEVNMPASAPDLTQAAARAIAAPDLTADASHGFSALPEPLEPSRPSSQQTIAASERSQPVAPVLAEPTRASVGENIQPASATIAQAPKMPAEETARPAPLPLPPVMEAWQDPIRNPSSSDPGGYGNFRKQIDVGREMGSQAQQFAMHTDELARNMSTKDEQDRQYRDIQYALTLRMIKDQTMDNRRLSEIERRYSSSRESIADVNL